MHIFIHSLVALSSLVCWKRMKSKMNPLWLPLWILSLLAWAHSFDLQLDDAFLPPIQDLLVGEPTTLKPSLFSLDATQNSFVACARLRICGISRFRNINKYAHSYRVKLQASEPHFKLNLENVEICFHWNASMGGCQCPKDQWKALEKGFWVGMASPYETRFIDIKITDTITGVSFNASVVEEFWPYRLVSLVGGFSLLLLAPVVSSWVPFYYSSAMTLGILLVVLILLYQGMKLLPTGRKSTLYIILYGSVVGMGTVVVHYFTGLVSSILREFGFNDEMYNPVAMFLLVSVILMGAWLGYWGVRKLVLSEDGTVDYGTSQFVKWAIRLIGSIMILQSSHDSLFALLALVTGVALSWAIRSLPLWGPDFFYALPLSWPECLSFSNANIIRRTTNRKMAGKRVQAEFLQKSEAMLLKSQANALHRSPTNLSHGTPISKTLESPSPRYLNKQQDFYSTFHQTPGSKGISKTEWDDLTEEYTKKAVTELVASPIFADWVVNHPERIKITPNEPREERPEEEIQRTAPVDEDKSMLKRLFW